MYTFMYFQVADDESSNSLLETVIISQKVDDFMSCDLDENGLVFVLTNIHKSPINQYSQIFKADLPSLVCRSHPSLIHEEITLCLLHDISRIRPTI